MVEPTPKALAKRMRELRLKAGLTQEQLAELADVSKETVSRLERAVRWPRMLTYLKIAEALGLGPGLSEPLRASDAGTSDSPLVRRLAGQAAQLDPSMLALVVRLVGHLPAKARGWGGGGAHGRPGGSRRRKP